jgi:hypothetical protein
MSKILANQIANYLDNAPIEVKEGVNIPAGKPLQVGGSSGTNGQVLTTDGASISWQNAPYFSGNYADLQGAPTIPAAQQNSDWNAVGGVTEILNKPVVPPSPSVVIAPAPSGGGNLTYNNVNGEFTYTPPDVSSVIAQEFDPLFSASPASNVTQQKIDNWDTAYGWGDHSTQNYITLTNLSVSQLPAVTGGSLTYDNTTGVVTYRPPDLSSYITSETSTFNDVVGRGGTTTLPVGTGDLTVNGDLIVTGTTTINNVTNYAVSTNEIVINDGQTGPAALNGSIRIDRGTGTEIDTRIRWNEGTDKWEFTNDGTTYYNFATNISDLNNDSNFLTSYTETDPIFSASIAASITNANITDWNEAHGWGDHATAGYLTAEADTLATISARGSSTSATLTMGGLVVNGDVTINGTQTIVNTTTLKVSDNEITLNNDVTGTPTENAGIEVERGLSANVRLRWDETVDRWQFTNNGSTYYPMPVALSDLANDSGFITSYAETDPVFGASPAAQITSNLLTNWNAAYGWGNHATAGYLTSYTESDPVFNAHPASTIGTTKISNWDTAYGWGDHSTQGYLNSLSSAVINDLGDVDTTSNAPTDGQALVWDATATNWVPGTVAASGGGGGASVTVSDTVPSTPSLGDLWWNSNEGALKIYYTDADSSQWVDASPSGSGSTGGGSGALYDLSARTTTATNAFIDLVGSDSTVDSVEFIGSGATEVLFNSNSGGTPRITLYSAPQIQADWNETDPNQPSFIENKPSIANASLVNLTDTTIAATGYPLNDGDILMYDSTAQTWRNRPDAAGLNTVRSVYVGNNLTIQAVGSNKFLKFQNGTGTYAGLADNNNSLGTSGQVLTADGNGGLNWQNLPGGAAYSTLASLTDTLIADGSNFLADKQILKYDVVAQKWVNSRISSINEIQDVDTSTAVPTNGQTLVWDNTNSLWKPGTISSGLTTLANESINDLGDVFVQSPSNGQILVYSSANSRWENAAPTGGSGGASVTVSDAAPTTPSGGDLWWESDTGRLKIYYQDTDSSQWVDASPALTPVANPNVPSVVGCINMNGTSPTWTGTPAYSVSGAQPGGAGTDYVYTLTFPFAYSARTDYIVQATYDGTDYISTNSCELAVARGTGSVVFTPRRLDGQPLSLGDIMVTIINL